MNQADRELTEKVGRFVVFFGSVWTAVVTLVVDGWVQSLFVVLLVAQVAAMSRALYWKDRLIVAYKDHVDIIKQENNLLEQENKLLLRELEGRL